MGALLIFLVFVVWQMPHFYAIAIYRLEDDAKPGIPVSPVKKGIFVMKINILLYIIAYLIAISLLTVLGYTGNVWDYIYFGIDLAGNGGDGFYDLKSEKLDASLGLGKCSLFDKNYSFFNHNFS